MTKSGIFVKYILKVAAIILIVLNGNSFALFAQLEFMGMPLVTNFLTEEIGASSQNWAMTQDNRGVMYIANNSGIIAYNGKQLKLISYPDLAGIRCISRDKHGKIYVGAYSNFGYLAADGKNNLKFVSLVNRLPDKYQNYGETWNIHNFNNELLVETDKYLFYIKSDTTIVFEAQSVFYYSFVVNNNFYIIDKQIGIKQLLNNKLEFVVASRELQTARIASMLPYATNAVLINTNKGFYLLQNNALTKMQSEYELLINNAYVYHSMVLSNGNFAYATRQHGLLVYDKNLKLVRKIDHSKGLSDQTLNFVYEDFNNHIWVCSESGFSMLELNNPVQYFDIRNLLDANISDIIVYNNIVYVATTRGIKYCKLSDYKADQNPVFNILTESTNLVNTFFIYNSELYFGYFNGLGKIDKNNAISYIDTSYVENLWVFHKPEKVDDVLLAGTETGIAVYKKINNNLKFSNLITSQIIGVRSFFEDSMGNYWISTINNGVFKTRINNTFDSLVVDKVYDKSTGLFSNFFNTSNLLNNQIIITTQNQTFLYNPKTDTIESYYPFNKYLNWKKFGVTYLGTDSLNRLIVHDDSGNIIGKIYKNTFISLDSFTLNRTNKDLIKSVFPVSKKITLIGQGSIVLILNNEISKQTNNKQFNCYIDKIVQSNTDSVLCGGIFLDSSGAILKNQPENYKLDINYQNNSIRIWFYATFFENPDETQFSYRLVGFNNEWSTWSNESFKDYTNIPPGNYKFEVKARNIYKQQSNIATINVAIIAPWYRTSAAFIVYAVFGIILLISFIKLYTLQLKRANTKLENLVRERTSEIDNKNTELQQQNIEILERNAEITQQKEEILLQSEQLELINKELEKLSVVARNTDNAILLLDKDGNFEWVNSAFTQIFGYTLDELKTNISNNIIGKNTSPEIQKLIENCFENKKSVSYEFKVSHKNGKEIWIHTTLSPVLNEDDEISNVIAIDSDITLLKKAEQEIEFQNENIKGSIRYAHTIQQAILPDANEILPYFKHFVIYKPKDIVSGDFYWFSKVHDFDIQSDIFFFAVVDCTGHGVPGGFMSMISSRLLDEIVIRQQIYAPGAVLDTMDKELKKALKQEYSDIKDGMDIGLIAIECINYNLKPLSDFKIAFAGAKINLFIFPENNQEFIKVHADRKNIGGNSINTIQFRTHIMHQKSSDLLILATDGLPDQNNPFRKKFGVKHMLQIIQQNHRQSPEIIKSALESELQNWQQSEFQRDDITVLGIKL